ncbi:MAG TPA: M4 family metallopeptidase [Vicinamibacterales bacterium]|nr:M4 family metallopeptidase [Vicinamibacterales bacterium]
MRRVCFAAVLLLALSGGPSAQTPQTLVTIAPASLTELRSWDVRTQQMLRDGELRVRDSRPDTLIPGRVIERSDQFYEGVRVFGGDIARQLQTGVLQSVFGRIYTGIDVDPSPAVAAEDAQTTIEKRTGVKIGPSHAPELVVFARPSGGFVLAWRIRAATRSDIRQYFVDAHSGAVVFDYSTLETQSAVGRARGVLGDTKKISAQSVQGHFIAHDLLRPPDIDTLDMKADLSRTLAMLNGDIGPQASDIASDDDNDWTDGAVDDAHVYQGWTYDYYYKRFGRHGLDNHDLPIVGFANPVKRADIFNYSDDVIGTFFLNAFYAGGGWMVYGVGLPAGLVTEPGDQTWDYMSGALDVVGHELTHGVTEYTSNLIYLNESGALNEAFSDIMGTSIEFFFQKPGNGPEQADYLCGEDVVRPGGLRSMSDPQSHGQPDHYSKRYLGPDDNGGVHTNSGIANNAFYLAIEGGANRTSGLSVQGVGSANREQIEKVFYRAFTQLMPSNATFSIARATTIQAARDLYGAGSPAETAVTQAWTAVGVK